jgi:hypothetical protein
MEHVKAGESTGIVASRTEPSAEGANAEGNVRVGDKRSVSRETLNDELKKYWDGALAKWKASGEYPLDRHVAAVGCDGHRGCYTVSPFRILSTYPNRYCSAHLPKPQMDTITAGLQVVRREALKTETSPARVGSSKKSLEAS